MKKTNLLRLFCALLGIITLLSAIPVFAEDSTPTETTVTPFDVTFDFEYGKEIQNVNGTREDASQTNGLHTGNISQHITNTDVSVSTPFDLIDKKIHCYIVEKPEVDNNYALKVANDAGSYFAVKDVNKKLPGGDFTVSIDVYLNLTDITNKQSLIQWIRDAELPDTGNDGNAKYKNPIVRTNSQGQIDFLNTPLTNVTLSGATWHNITVKARCISDNNYEWSLFVDKDFVATKVYAVTAPTDGTAGSYMVFFSRNNSAAPNSYMDNIHIYDTYTPDMKAPLDVYMDLEYGKNISKHLNGTFTSEDTPNGLHEGNISPYMYNPDIEVRTNYDYTDAYNRGIHVLADPDGSTNYVLKVVSTNSYFAIKDKYKKLAGGDFTVSADIYLDLDYEKFTDTLPLIQWTRDGDLAVNEISNNITNRYTFISVKEDGTLTANAKNLGTTLRTATWYNIKVVAERISEDNEKYTISLYLDNVFLTSYELDMPAPDDDNEGSYIVFFTRGGTGCMGSCIDNIRIIEHDELDVTLDFNTLEADKVVQGTDVDPMWLNIGDLLNTDKITITFPRDYNPDHKFAYKTVAPDSGENIVLQLASRHSYIALEDLGSRLEKSDFIVSADMSLNFNLEQFTTGELSLLQWAKGAQLSDSKLYNLVSVDNHGQLIAGGNGLGVYVDLNDWFNIAARVNYLTDDSYEVAIYLDEKLIYVYNLDMPSNQRSFIRFLGTGVEGFGGSEIDNLRISETEVGTSSFVDIWDVDFNDFENETVMNADNWSAASSIYPVVSVGGEYKIENGKLKISSTSSSSATELSIGGRGYEPILRYGSAAISMKFELSAVGTTDVSHSLISWKKFKDEASILGFKNKKLVFCGITLSDEIKEGNEYDLKVVIDGYRKLAELYVDGEKKVSSALILGVDTDISTFDRLSEVIAMFASSANDESVVYYVDDLKIERVDRASNFDVSFDFTGWSGYSPLPASDKMIGLKSDTTSTKNLPTVAKTENGNEYLSGDDLKRFFINDINGELQYNNFVLEFDLYYTNGNGGTDTKNIIDFNAGLNSDKRGGVLYADGSGNLMISSTEIAKGISGKWTPIKIEFITDDTNAKWTKVKVSVNGAEEKEISWSGDFAQQMSFRFIPQSIATFGWDNVRLYTVEETTAFKLDFNGNYETALDNVGKANCYPTIDSKREGADGKTYTSAELSTKSVTVGDKVEDQRFLRINRTELKTDQDGYFHVDKADFIGLDEYIVEADFGFTSVQDFGINPVTIVGKNGAKKFTPVVVLGDSNTLQIDINGDKYELLSSDGTPLKVKTTDENGFTKLAVLINEKASTYTVYVDERIAYYCYGGEYLPCAGLPIHYTNTGTYTSTTGYLRVMETSSLMNNASIIDIARVAIIPSTSGLNTSFRGVQSNVTDPDGYAVRFVGGIDALYGDAVGFDVIATYIGNDVTTPTKTTKTTLEDSVVYSSILEIDFTKTAEELGSNYLFAMTVNKIFYDVTEVDFEIVPFVKHGGIPFYGEKTLITAQYADREVYFTVNN